MMEGRWTIWWDSDLGQNDVEGPSVPREGGVPVVPCDDAAVNRAVMALGLYFTGRSHRFVKAAAEAVLRAAGETP